MLMRQKRSRHAQLQARALVRRQTDKRKRPLDRSSGRFVVSIYTLRREAYCAAITAASSLAGVGCSPPARFRRT